MVIFMLYHPGYYAVVFIFMLNKILIKITYFYLTWSHHLFIKIWKTEASLSECPHLL